MKRRIVAISTAIGLFVALAAPGVAGTASAHSTGPCNGEGTGQEYAQHHIKPRATTGLLGSGGHKPGEHRGYSVCLGVHA